MWHQITPSGFPWERAALDLVKALLPERHPYQAWSNFTFVSDHGHVREVDLLVAAPSGLHLVEIKNFTGRLKNQGSTWILENDRRRPPFDSPLPLADQKAKELKSLLAAAGRGERLRVPFVRGSLFLAERSMRAELDDHQRHHLYGPEGNAAGLPPIGELLLAQPHREPIDQQFARRLHALLQKVGIHRTQKSISIGPWRIEPQPYESGPTWQDHHARRPDNDAAYRRARIYLYERQEDREAQESTRLAAQREFAAGQGIQHPGLLVPTDLLDHEMGPALLIDQSPEAQRLDHWLVAHDAELDLPTRLGLIRQLAEAVRYAHDRRLVHRALSPRAIVVEDGDDGPRLRVGEWQTATRGLSSSQTVHRVEVTQHAGRHVEGAAQGYLAPEFREDADGMTTIDVFGLGATAYLILTGKPPASTRAELFERLTAEGGLHPRAVDDSLPDDVDQLVAQATDPIVGTRCPDVDEFLVLLGIVEDDLRESVHPEPEPERDPFEAAPGDRLNGEYEVVTRLGTGATARALLVRRDHEEAVLKIGRDDRAASRLGDEAAVLADLAHDHVVRLRRGTFTVGSRTAIEVTLAGQRTLAHQLRADGALLPDQLHRFGAQLLDALAYLERHQVRHRDIKPDNIGVLTHPKRGTSVVLFDFSLAGVPDADVTAGTRGYRDPFLGTLRRPAWDAAAERYGAAATIHEMASGELPGWGDDGTDPRVGDQSATLAEEVFDAAVRDPLVAFFRRAFAREADDRYDSADAMRRAWEDVFAEIDETGPATVAPSWSDDPQQVRDDVAARATLDTALDAAGLSLRAVAVAQRLGAGTVADLLEIPTRTIGYARGLSRGTRNELLRRVGQWRRDLAPGTSGPVTEAPPDESAPAALDALVGRLIPATPKRGVDQAAVTRRILGLPDAAGALPATRWPTTTALATEFGLTSQRIGQILGAQRERWRADPLLRRAARDVADSLAGLGRVATARELADQLLVARGCPSEEDPARRRAVGYAVLRAVVESDDPEAPRFATRRHRDRLLVALQVGEDESMDTPGDFALLEMAGTLGDEAVDLAQREPLPTPVTVVRELGAVAAAASSALAEQRLVQLAASAAEGVLANARLELYPADLPPERAIRLSQAGAAIPADGLKPEIIAGRVAARFPGLAPLPPGAELEKLLKALGIDVWWDGTAIRPRSTVAASSSVLEPVSPPTAATDPRLDVVQREGGVRVVTARRSSWASARARVATVTGAEVHDAGLEFAAMMREVAAEHGVRSFTTVVRADIDDAPARARTNLAKIVARALERLEERWRAAPVLVLDGLTPFGRYDGAMALLERLMAAARDAGRVGGPRTLVLLCVAADERVAPHVDQAAIGVVGGDEWLVATPSWLAGSDAA